MPASFQKTPQQFSAKITPNDAVRSCISKRGEILRNENESNKKKYFFFLK